MKRYLLFGGECYYAAGGWDDFIKDADNLDALIAEADSLVSTNAKIKQEKYNYTIVEWAQIVDLETGQVVHGENTAYQSH